MRVYVMRLEGAQNLAWAFEVISNAREVASCTFEPRLHQVRFVAPHCEADALAERIYLDGGLLWCSRHDLEWSPVSGRPGKNSARSTVSRR
ncbi:MAG: hypothetical protein JRE57_03480 [Deltaproteobacteria bacterium]|nr:hypothetical protein [Deltaproteobacteria bacterium]